MITIQKQKIWNSQIDPRSGLHRKTKPRGLRVFDGEPVGGAVEHAMGLAQTVVDDDAVRALFGFLR